MLEPQVSWYTPQELCRKPQAHTNFPAACYAMALTFECNKNTVLSSSGGDQPFYSQNTSYFVYFLILFFLIKE